MLSWGNTITYQVSEVWVGIIDSLQLNGLVLLLDQVHEGIPHDNMHAFSVNPDLR